MARLDSARELPLAAELVEGLAALGVERAFGVGGGAVVPLFDALDEHEAITLHHFRHESAATLAAAAAGFASRQPSLIFVAAGPGTLRALFGLAAARHDGARVLLVSGTLGIGAPYALPQDGLSCTGRIFHFAHRLAHPAELPEVLERLRGGWARPQGFVAHLAIPVELLGRRVAVGPRHTAALPTRPAAPPQTAEACVRLLGEEPFAVWAGFGAREAATEIRELLERTGARAFCSPRGKGIVPEDHPSYLGVTGAGGHTAVLDYMAQEKPRFVLVLGSRLGEATSLWDRDMRPGAGFIHVDLDPEVPGAAYPDVPTVGIQAEVGTFVRQLLRLLPQGGTPRLAPRITHRLAEPIALPRRGRVGVRPRVLFQAIQRRIVEPDEAPLYCATSLFTWANRYLRFATPGRYWVSTFYGCRGQASAGALGAALARGSRAFAVIEAASLLAQSEISTAVRYGMPLVWIAVDKAADPLDGALGVPAASDILAVARAAGAEGLAVRTEDELDGALETARRASSPFVISVALDPDEPSPLVERLAALSPN